MSRDWEAILHTWVKPASNAEDERRQRTERAITNALNALPDVRDLPIVVYAKGSYANNTNVRLDSDVDVAVEYKGIQYYDFMHDLEGMTGEQAGFSGVTAPYSPEQLKADVERALVAAFGPLSGHPPQQGAHGPRGVEPARRRCRAVLHL